MFLSPARGQRVSLAEDLAALEDREPRVLTVDIETSPNIAYVWGLFDQNIGASQVIEPSRMLCFAAKWLDDPAVTFRSEFHDGREAMVATAWQLLDEADIVVGYNHVRFDILHMNREFLSAGYGPPSPWQDVDLYQVNKRRFKFTSNKLGYVTEYLGLDTKLETGGQTLWNRVLEHDPDAWELFRQYNETDVVITEALFLRLRPWLKLPHIGLWSGELSNCYSCDSANLEPAGTVFGKTSAWPKLVCDDCGAVNKVLRNGQTRAA